MDNLFEFCLKALLVFLLLILIVGMLIGVYTSFKNQDKLMKQCMADHKEYECVAMFRSGSRSTAPIIITVR